LLFAFRSTLSLTDAQVTLTAWGGLFQALLRLTGPVLLALTLLALRGREAVRQADLNRGCETGRSAGLTLARSINVWGRMRANTPQDLIGELMRRAEPGNPAALRPA
jgi:hypothetical protein